MPKNFWLSPVMKQAAKEVLRKEGRDPHMFYHLLNGFTKSVGREVTEKEVKVLLDVFIKNIGKEVPSTAMSKIGVNIAEKAIAKAGSKGAAKCVGKQVAKNGLKEGGAKAVAKKIPLLCVCIGIAFAIPHVIKGEYGEATLEVASGVVATVPGYGTAASIAIDGLLMGISIKKAM